MFTPSNQQLNIKNTILSGANTAIIAGAGTGKTSTIMYVGETYRKKSLYIVFNKANEVEATNKFKAAGLEHIEARTINSLAYRAIITSSAWRAKLKAGFLNRQEIIEVNPEIKFISDKGKLTYFITKLINEFCGSAYESLEEFVYSSEELTKSYESILTFAENYWINLTNPACKFSISHNTYLKLFQLYKPTLPYEVIYVDEFQDSNPVTVDIVLNQKSQVVVIGDPHQSIYQFRGAKDSFSSVPEDFTKCYLTESYRFHSKIADKANKILYRLEADFELSGLAEESNKISSRCYIARTNTGVMQTLISYAENKQKIHLIGDLEPVWKKLWALYQLRAKNLSKCFDGEIKSLETWENFLSLVDDNPEYKFYLSLLNSKRTIPELKSLCEAAIASDPSESMDYITTAHKSKGLEWDEVILLADFNLKKEENQDSWDLYFLPVEYLNLVYVAVTRAKKYVTSDSELVNLLLS